MKQLLSFPPSTPGDLIARLIRPALQAAWSQPVIIDDKAGAGGNLAAGEMAQTQGDHTLLVGPDRTDGPTALDVIARGQAEFPRWGMTAQRTGLQLD